jgi:quercetin dioxygenase-like cupin family protein
MIRRSFACAAILAGAASLAAAQEKKAEMAAVPGHVLVSAAGIVWGEAPPALPKGATVAVLSGDPGQSGPFTVRVKFPAGYRVAPHWHPTDENLTVLSGSLSLGMGETYDEAAAKALGPGDFSVMPAEMRHFAFSKGGVTFQIHGNGPFTLTYVNPGDDPRNQTARER